VASVEFIRALGLIIVFAAGFVLVGRRFGIPSIASSMIAGLVLGPILGLLDGGATAAAVAAAADGGAAPAPATGPETLALISEVGIVLLLFLVGLELSLDEIRAVGPVAVVAGLLQSVVMGGLVMAVGLASGLGMAATVVLAIAVGFSSTVVVIKQLESQGQLDRSFGRIAVGILLVQDLIVVIVLTVLAGLSSAGSMDAAVVAGAMGRAFGLMGVLLVVTLVCARFVLPRLFEMVGRSPASGLVWSLAWCFVLVEAAYLMGLSVEIGAFLAGLGLSSLPHRHDIRRRVRPLMGFFIAVFFASLGSRIDFGDLADRWPLALALTLLVLLVKPPAFMLLIRLMGHSRRVSFDAAITLMQISEFSLILGAAALTVPGLIDPSDTSAISLLGVVALATILVSVLMMNGRDPAFRLAGRIGLLRLLPGMGGGDAEDPAAAGDAAAADGADAADGAGHHATPTGHVVVVGMNALGRRLVVDLTARGERVAAVDTDAGKLTGLSAIRVVGDIDHPETRAEAGLADARLAVCTLRVDEANRLFAYRCRTLGVPFVVHAFDRFVRPDLAALGPAWILEPKQAADEQVERIVTAMGTADDAADAGDAGDADGSPGDAAC
jgi:Kef-type K+ transport system membrane component KefB